jgi:hypothetical protein
LPRAFPSMAEPLPTAPRPRDDARRAIGPWHRALPSHAHLAPPRRVRGPQSRVRASVRVRRETVDRARRPRDAPVGDTPSPRRKPHLRPGCRRHGPSRRRARARRPGPRVAVRPHSGRVDARARDGAGGIAPRHLRSASVRRVRASQRRPSSGYRAGHCDCRNRRRLGRRIRHAPGSFPLPRPARAARSQRGAHRAG